MTNELVGIVLDLKAAPEGRYIGNRGRQPTA
jgi:hypothetical protein